MQLMIQCKATRHIRLASSDTLSSNQSQDIGLEWGYSHFLIAPTRRYAAKSPLDSIEESTCSN